MRKGRKQQKNRDNDQLELYVGQAKRPIVFSTDGISHRERIGVELLSKLESQRTLTKEILEEIVDYGNLKRSIEQVVRNGGASGVDGMEIPEFKEWIGSNINQLRTSLLEESYEPSPVLKIEIPKASGGKRILGIPTVKDRFIQLTLVGWIVTFAWILY